MFFIYVTALYVVVAVFVASVLRAKGHSTSPRVRAAEDAEQMAAIHPRATSSTTRDPLATLH